VTVALSADGGATWQEPATLAADGDPAVPPAMVATRTGLAVVYADRAGRLLFWHGSVERIEGAPMVPAHERLDAPPDEVHDAHGLRA
jgi:hypothetical protein